MITLFFQFPGPKILVTSLTLLFLTTRIKTLIISWGCFFKIYIGSGCLLPPTWLQAIISWIFSSLLVGLHASTFALCNLLSTKGSFKNPSHMMSLSCSVLTNSFHLPQIKIQDFQWYARSYVILLPATFMTSSSITFFFTLFHPHWPPYWISMSLHTVSGTCPSTFLPRGYCLECSSLNTRETPSFPTSGLCSKAILFI